MKWTLGIIIALFAASNAAAQAPSPPERGFLNRMFHPFASAKNKAPKYQDSRLRGLLLEVQVPTEPIRLSEVRQLRVQAILRNIGTSPITTVIHRATGSSATLGRFCSRGSIRRGPKESSISLLLITIAIMAASISTNSIVYVKKIPT